KDIHTVAPEMPNGYYPQYEIWKKEFERFDINTQTALIGHSCGAGFIVRWLTENVNQKVDKVILVAPWMGIRFSNEPFDDSFFDFEPRRDIATQTNGLHIFNSTDDFSVVLKSVELIRQKVCDVQYREFKGKGHFTETSLGTVEFPELLVVLLKVQSRQC